MDLDSLPKLEVGQKAPDFTAKTQSGENFTLSKAVKEGKVFLIFYPADDTPGCTKQLCGVRDIYAEYKNLGVKVLGINHGDSSSHQKFIDKYSFPFDIIIDEDKSIRDSYGAVKKFFNNFTTKRGVYLVDENQTIIYKHWGQQDNQEVLEVIKNT